MRPYLLMWLIVVWLSSPNSCPAEQTDFSLHVSSSSHSLKVPSDLDAETVLENPLVANPLYVHFDGRGRLWLVEYRQYPWPAGLQLLSRDAVWRNRYEPAFPPPPPHAKDSPFRGRDRISIHEDTNGDGKFDKSKVFLDGLNFATAALPGRGGVFVMNPPYLLFYADRNGDDQPDDPDPRILLSGFGIEDSHSIANSLRWGPDGWIYATQGSTVSGSIVRHGDDNEPLADEQPVHSLGQNLWRYHPERHQYEIFAEGGGNAFGVEIDRFGRAYSGHNGGNTRGFHYIQGGYYQKTFGKHGELSNPFAFGYFPDMQHHDVKRFSHTFVIYESTELPTRYHGRLFGVNPVEHYVIHSAITAHGSSRQTRDIATVLEPGNGERADWFTPVDIQTGPDGALYVADWFAVQSNHYRNHEGETNPELGRVVRIGNKDQRPTPKFDLDKIASSVLVDQYLTHKNRWFRHQALRILGDRHDTSLHKQLLGRLRGDSDYPLEFLWALNHSGGIPRALLPELMNHPNEHVRLWCVRLWADQAEPDDQATAELVADLAKRERSREVVSQIICSARRLDGRQAMPIIASVITRDEMADDVHIPLSLWWAIEAVAGESDAILTLFTEPTLWQRKWKPGGATLWANLVKRYVMIGDQSSLLACARLMQRAPSARQEELIEAFAMAVEGRRLPSLPNELELELAKAGGIFATVLAIRRGDETATRGALAELPEVGKSQSENDALRIIEAIGDTRALPKLAVAKLLETLDATAADSIRNAVLVALQRFDTDQVGNQVVSRLPNFSASVRETAESMLASRVTWAWHLLEAYAKDRSIELQSQTVSRLRLHKDPELRNRVSQLFPILASSDAELRNQTARFLQVIGQGRGEPLNGKELFHAKANCGKCHRLFSEGGEIGPDLTPYNRTNIRDMLLAIVRPSAEVREGYENHTVITADGQVVSGLKIEANDRLVILRGGDGQSRSIPMDDVEELTMSKQSLMPAGLLDGLSDDEIRDLFAYLVSTTPPK